MKTFNKFLMLMVFLGLSSATIHAQDDQIYYVFDYMKVEPGMQADYLKLEKAWKKMHASSVKNGAYDSWTLTQVVSPLGTSVEYNYVTRIKITGDKQLAAYMSSGGPGDWQSLLTAEEKDLVNRTDEIRTFVKSEVWSNVDRVLDENMEDAKVSVVNFFKTKAGQTSANHHKVEIRDWKPVHAATVKSGGMKGWVLLQRFLPLGADYPYQDITVDIYKDMDQFMAHDIYEPLAKVHPGKTPEAIFANISEVVTRTRGEVRVRIDSTN